MIAGYEALKVPFKNDETSGTILMSPYDVRDRYTTAFLKDANSRWPKGSVEVWELDEGGNKTRLVTTYNRGYSFYKTFEPFQQEKDGIIHDYALISSVYTRSEVLDLESGEIVAIERGPIITEEMYKKSSTYYDRQEKKPGDYSHPVFCPVDFMVPNIHDVFYEYYDEEFPNNGKDATPEQRFEKLSELFSKWSRASSFKPYEGRLAFYSGTVWGDDHAMKMRTLDLSHIDEGYITSHTPYGYAVISKGIREAVKLEFESNVEVDIVQWGYFNDLLKDKQ